MGDNINLDWGTLGTQDNPNAFAQGYANARQISLNGQADHARADALANPTDMNALTKFATFDPNGFAGMQQGLGYQRMMAANQARSDLFSSYAQQQAAAPQQQGMAPPNAFAPQQGGAMPAQSGPMPAQGAPQAPVDPLAPLPAQGGPQAPQGAPQGQQGQQGQQQGASSQQGGPLSNPSHPVNQQLGQAAMQGQISPMQAWAAVARYTDPADIEKLQVAISSMSKLDVERIDRTTTAIGSAAQTMLGRPPEEWSSMLQQMAPQLIQQGVPAERIQALLAKGITQNDLLGFVGQSLGTKGLIEQSNQQRTFSQKDTELATSQQNANSQALTAQSGAQHNRWEENKPVSVGMTDTLVSPNSGKVVYDPMGGGGGDINSKILQVEGTARNPASSAAGPGQFVNATFRKYIAGASPQVAQAIAGMSDAQLTAYRAANANALAPITTQMTAALTQNNQQTLSARGVPVNDGNTYMAHVFGAGGTAAAINAGPSASAAGFVGGAKALTNNGLPANATVGQVQQWAQGKMSGAGGGGAGSMIETQAQAIARGDQSPFTNRAAASGIGARIMGRVFQINPNYDAKDYGSANHALSQWNSGGPNSGATQVRNINVSINHLASLAGALHALNNGDTPLFNKIANSFKQATGSELPTNANGINILAMNEVNKATIGMASAESDRSKAQGMMPINGSAAQQYGGVGAIQDLLGARIDGLRQQYETSTTHKDFDKFLSDPSRRVLQRYNQQNAGGGRQAPAAGTVVSGFRFKGGDPASQASWEPAS